MPIFHLEWYASGLLAIFCYYDTIFLIQVTKAAPIFNKYRRNGQKFDVKLYNRIIQGWADQVTIT